ncbi:MAG: hypothetical protein ABI273_08065 [Lacunisphaera sp.]
MNETELALAIAPLKRLNFKIERGYPQFVCESQTHRIKVFLFERETTLYFDVTLRALPKSWIDCFSIINYYCPEVFSGFMNAERELSDESILTFVIDKLTSDCSGVFDVTSTSEWMKIHQSHRQSLKRRNESFWAIVSGYRDTYAFTSRQSFTEEPRATW